MTAVGFRSRALREQRLETDVVVVGGGMAGTCAAIAAARNGARVVLIQDRSVLGGNASSEIRMHIVGADNHGKRPGARESGLIEELRLEDAVRNPHRSYSQWDLLLYEKVRDEPGITLLLDTACVSCTQDAGTGAITSVVALRNSTEDLYEIAAPVFVDCSGDSRLAVEAGADLHVGREERGRYGESLARDEPDRKTLGSSILMTARRHDAPQPFTAPAWARTFTAHDLRLRPVAEYVYGHWWHEWGGQLDTVRDNPAIRDELLRIVLGVWDYVKNSGDHPDAADWAVDWVGSIPGKRESRRLLGPHVLTQNDLEAGRIFEDAVAYGGWPMDLHPPEGVDAPGEHPATQHELAALYTIPLASLRSRNVPNLLFAGRNISATHVAFASTRVMATCAAMGQAVGTAAAVAVRLGVGLADLPIAEVQRQLLEDDAFIPTLAGSDPDDLAREGTVSASSEAPGGEAELVLDGHTRDLVGDLGPWADQRAHHWASTTLPAWIQLEWTEHREIGEVQLTFDTGFERALFLTASDHFSAQILRRPQPETVRTYRIEVDGRTVIEVDGNHLRKRVHRLPAPVVGRTLRVVVLETHGVPGARIFEIRTYPPGRRR